jgi:hypothetical protein
MYTPRQRRLSLDVEDYSCLFAVCDFICVNLRLFLWVFGSAVTPFDKAGRLVLVPRSARATE